MRSRVRQALQRDTPQDPGPFRRRPCHQPRTPALGNRSALGGAPAASANASVTLYVSTAGSSTSGCTASGAGACKTIQEGVTAAEAYSSSAVTVMVAAGTYDENDTIDVPSGDTLTLQGAGASSRRQTAAGQVRSSPSPRGPAAIDDLSITDGSGAGAPGEVNGGGVDNTGGTVTLTGDTLSNNAVLDYGGAVSNGVGATVTLTDDTLVGNWPWGWRDLQQRRYRHPDQRHALVGLGGLGRRSLQLSVPCQRNPDRRHPFERYGDHRPWRDLQRWQCTDHLRLGPRRSPL